MRNISESHLTFSVLISLGNSSGSGFLYRTDEHVYLVTAKHVLYDENRNFRVDEIEIVCQSSELKDESVNRYRINLKDVISKFHLKSDVAIVNLGKVKNRIESRTTFAFSKGVEQLQKGNKFPVVASIKDINKFDEVMISNDVYVFGYPTSLGIETSKQFDQNKPLLRKGIVANVQSSEKTIILDCPVYGGNSGGPVIQVIEINNKKKLRLIGIVSQYIPFVQRWKNERDRIIHLEYLNSGYSVATSFDCVLELIED